MNILEYLLEYLFATIFCYVVAFCISWGIVETWVLFWEYGWIWNETTVPPLVLWDIFFTNISLIAIIALFITPVAFIIILLFLER